MKKVIVIAGLIVFFLYLVSCTPAIEEGALAGQASVQSSTPPNKIAEVQGKIAKVRAKMDIFQREHRNLQKQKRDLHLQLPGVKEKMDKIVVAGTETTEPPPPALGGGSGYSAGTGPDWKFIDAEPDSPYVDVFSGIFPPYSPDEVLDPRYLDLMPTTYLYDANNGIRPDDEDMGDLTGQFSWFVIPDGGEPLEYISGSSVDVTPPIPVTFHSWYCPTNSANGMVDCPSEVAEDPDGSGLNHAIWRASVPFAGGFSLINFLGLITGRSIEEYYDYTSDVPSGGTEGSVDLRTRLPLFSVPNRLSVIVGFKFGDEFEDEIACGIIVYVPHIQYDDGFRLRVYQFSNEDLWNEYCAVLPFD